MWPPIGDLDPVSVAVSDRLEVRLDGPGPLTQRSCATVQPVGADIGDQAGNA